MSDWGSTLRFDPGQTAPTSMPRIGWIQWRRDDGALVRRYDDGREEVVDANPLAPSLHHAHCCCLMCEHVRTAAAEEQEKKRQAEIARANPAPPAPSLAEQARLRAEAIHLCAMAFEAHMDRTELVDLVDREWRTAFGGGL